MTARRLVPAFAAAALVALVLVRPAAASHGLVTVDSAHDVKTTVDWLVAALEAKGMTVFARIDHAAGAAKVGMPIPATELVIFGNPKAGTPLMQCAPAVAIDLPQKALIWEDGDGKVHLGYNAPAYLVARHGIPAKCNKVIENVTAALAKFAAAATGSE